MGFDKDTLSLLKQLVSQITLKGSQPNFFEAAKLIQRTKEQLDAAFIAAPNFEEKTPDR